MEVLSLLKYWRGGGGGSAVSAAVIGTRPAVSTTTISSSAFPPATETDDDSSDDEGPFFDLEFTVPDEESEGARFENEGVDIAEGGQRNEARNEASDDEREFDLTLTSEGSCTELRADPNLTCSPSDDLFFKGRFVPLESSSLAFKHSESGTKSQMLPVSLLKTKFRVLMFGFRRPKGAHSAAAAGEPPSSSVPVTVSSPKNPSQRQGKLLAVKFKVEEVPIVSLFTRDNSSRSTTGSNGRSPKQQADDTEESSLPSSGEKKLPKELVQKYLGKIKPLYVRVSKRYAEKLRFSGQLSSEGVVPKDLPSSVSKELEKREGEAASSPPHELPGSPGSAKTVQKQNQSGSLPAGLRVVCKQLGKSRSASAAVAAVPSPPPPVIRRRDDSLLQLQDGIQSAIAHCKMSLSACKGWFILSLPARICSFIFFQSVWLRRSSLFFLEPDVSTACCEKAREDFM
ncbi:unnamed protein product [Spirodela intermedia]|uniref:Uncharacterized protein n=1 Tax=Spirodela intermedia TaxID=51605 RepID=A0A7I8J939_SPIIN|nr:unnamed protein product [Spirodela intermedia]CAA6665943.1 unnamed protein product [Spirodela intermedia]